MGISQPTVGRHVALLESQRGTLLFERTGRGRIPTPSAQRLADAVRTMEAGAQTLLRGAQQSHTTLSGSVRLSASQPVACHLLPLLIAHMRSELPGTQVELVSSNAMSDLLRRKADIAIRMVRPTQSSLVARRIGESRGAARAHRGYLARRSTPQQPEDWLQHDLMGNDRVADTRQGFAATGHPVPVEQCGFRIADLIADWQTVRAGIGIGFVVECLLPEDPDIVQCIAQPASPRAPRLVGGAPGNSQRSVDSSGVRFLGS